MEEEVETNISGFLIENHKTKELVSGHKSGNTPANGVHCRLLIRDSEQFFSFAGHRYLWEWIALANRNESPHACTKIK